MYLQDLHFGLGIVVPIEHDHLKSGGDSIDLTHVTLNQTFKQTVVILIGIIIDDQGKKVILVLAEIGKQQDMLA